MSPETMTWLWLLAGILLVVSELFLPGLVAVFLGLGAMLVALLDSVLGSVLVAVLVPSTFEGAARGQDQYRRNRHDRPHQKSSSPTACSSAVRARCSSVVASTASRRADSACCCRRRTSRRSSLPAS